MSARSQADLWAQGPANRKTVDKTTDVKSGWPLQEWARDLDVTPPKLSFALDNKQYFPVRSTGCMPATILGYGTTLEVVFRQTKCSQMTWLFLHFKDTEATRRGRF